MKQEKEEHTFKVINKVYYGREIFPVVNMEINGEASIGDLLYAFERFIQAIGYVLPENSHIELVEEEDYIQPYKQNNEEGVFERDY